MGSTKGLGENGIKQLLYAPNIHQGGGKTLLLPLLKQLEGEAIFILDQRLELPPELVNIEAIWTKPNLLARLYMELKLCQLTTKETTVLCMGNLPPLFAKGILKVFLQNRYLVERISLKAFKKRIQARIICERAWLYIKSSSVETFIVQTPTMQELLLNSLDIQAKVLPFIPKELMLQSSCKKEHIKVLYDFLYIASGEPHKNHKLLVEAWVFLAEQNLFPSLCLTFEKEQFPELDDWVTSMVDRFDLNIVIVGEIPHENIDELYQQSAALIYPSEYESFGLPLIEAVILDLPVLAIDRPYVTDVISPTASFKTDSSENIAEAVKSFDFKSASLAIDLLDTQQFIYRAFGSV